ncbi:hypothetical protein D3C87_24100 [compost metagenome]
MSSSTVIESISSKSTFYLKRIQVLSMRFPEWWIWLFSAAIWILLLINPLVTTEKDNHSGNLILCTATDSTPIETGSAFLKEADLSTRIFTAVSDGLPAWGIMIAAMMFPLLNEPIRHVAFSVRQKDRDKSILYFLFGYTIVWILSGVLFLLIPIVLNLIIVDQSSFLKGLIGSFGFLLAALSVWFPNRLEIMTKYNQTMPIRIQSPYLQTDSISYGLKMGIACMRMCWIPMIALMLAHHNLILMLVVTIILLYERYRLPHISKLPGYAWGIIAFVLFGIETWSRFF